MNTIASRFLSFEETLGAGLVKFAYFVLLAVLAVVTIVAMIGGVVTVFTGGVGAGIAAFLLAPLRFVIALILLRVAAEVVLAILSIDDHLTDGARADGAMPSLRGGSGQGAAIGSGGEDPRRTEASKPENQQAPFAAAGGGPAEPKATDTMEPNATDTGEPKATRTGEPKATGTTEASSGGAKRVTTSPAETSGDKATKEAAPGAGGEGAGASSSVSAKKTAEAAKEATRPTGASTDGEKG